MSRTLTVQDKRVQGDMRVDGTLSVAGEVTSGCSCVSASIPDQAMVAPDVEQNVVFSDPIVSGTGLEFGSTGPLSTEFVVLRAGHYATYVTVTFQYPVDAPVQKVSVRYAGTVVGGVRAQSRLTANSSASITVPAAGYLGVGDKITVAVLQGGSPGGPGTIGLTAGPCRRFIEKRA